MELKFRALHADEIDCRIARVTEKGVQLLLYKDARCDMNILDETVGPMNWERKHTRDNANCIVSIWDEEKREWISKEDTGTESYTEKEKGLASDSFKRACVNWGIGRELYTAPFVWFPAQYCVMEQGKCKDRFRVTEIAYEKREIIRLKVRNEKTKAEYVFRDGTGSCHCQEGNDGKQPEEMSLPKCQAEEITDACERAGISLKQVFQRYRVNTLEEMTEAKKQACMEWLKRMM